MKGGEERIRIPIALILISAGIWAGPGLPARAGNTIGGTGYPDDIILSQAEREEILRGRIVLRNIAEPKRKGRAYEAIGLLRGSLEDNFEVITDYRRYPEFQPRVAKASVRDESASVAVVEITLKLPLGITRRFRLRYSAQKSEEGFLVSWQKLPWPELKPSQTVADTSGYWLVKKFDAGGLLAVTRAYMDPGSVPLGLTGIVNALSKQSLPGMIRSVRRRVRQLNDPERRAFARGRTSIFFDVAAKVGGDSPSNGAWRMKTRAAGPVSAQFLTPAPSGHIISLDRGY